MATRTLTIKFAGEIQDLVSKTNRAKSSLESMGKGLQSAGNQLTNNITKPVLGAVGAMAGLTAAAGFKRLVGIDTARAQFKGLGYDAEEVMKQVDAGVTGTALSMADGASMAVGILATGAVPMKELEDQIKRVSNVSAAYGLEASHAGNLLNNVLVKQKVEWGDLSQMQQNQIPIVSQLADHFGVTGAEIQKMAQDGKISIEDLNTVLDKNAGAAAEEYAKSWQGITANIRSNIGRIGAAALEPTFEILKDQASGFLDLLRGDDFKTAAADFGQLLGDSVQRLIDRTKALIEWWGGLSDDGRRLALTIAGIAVAAGPVLVGVGKLLVFMSGLQKAFIIATGAAKILAGAFLASPIGWIVAGIAAVTAGLVWFFTRTETGRAVFQRLWAGVKDVIDRIGSAFTGLKELIVNGNFTGALREAFGIEEDHPVVGWILDARDAVFGFVDDVKGGLRAFGEAWKAFDGDITSSGFAGWMELAAFKVRSAWEWIKDAAAATVAWYQQHVAPVFSDIGALIAAIVEEWIVPALAWLWETWQKTWSQIQAIWRVIGPPLLTLIGTGFRNLMIILETIWNGIKIVIETVLGVIRGIIQMVTALIRGDWAGAWEAMKRIFSTVWDGTKRLIENAVNGVSRWLSNSWDGIKRAASQLWGGVRDSIMGVVDPLVSRMTSAFERAKDGIGSALEKIKGAAARPINFVINTVWNDGLRAALNLIPGVDLARANPIKGYATGGNTGPGHRLQPAGVVHAGEHVWTMDEMRRFPGGHGAMERWRQDVLAGRTHHVPGYATGGPVRPVPGGHSGWNGGRYRNGGYHGGLDFPAATGTPVRAMWAGTVSRARHMQTSYGNHVILAHANGLQTLYAHMSQILTALGRSLPAGGAVGRVGSTGNSTGPHLHLEVRRGSARLNPVPFLAGASSAFAGVSTSATAEAEAAALLELPGKIRDIMDSVRTGLSGPWGDLIRTGVIESINTARDWALSKLPGGGYAHGIRNARKGWRRLGEFGPEWVNFGGGETVLPHRQSANLTSVGTRAIGTGGATVEEMATVLAAAIVAALAERERPDVTVEISEGDIRRLVRSEIRTEKRGGTP